MCALVPSTSFADYGQSCASLPSSLLDDYMMTSTAYGYLIDNIDMKKNIEEGCSGQPEKGIKFCIRNQGTMPCDVVEMSEGEKKLVSEISSNPEIGGDPYIGAIELIVDRVDQNLCLNMPTTRGPNPIICNPGYWVESDEEEIEKCRNISNACYRETKHSQSLLNFSGITIQCLIDSLDKIFFIKNVCPASEDDSLTVLAPFSEFQDALRTSIGAALIIYIMFYGFNVVMNPGSVDTSSVVTFIMKFLLVSYFAIGLGPISYQFGGVKQQNGMTHLALPFLIDATSGFAQMVYKAVGSKGLCEFDSSKYEQGYEYYGLWDAIDCRLGFYLGMQAMYNRADIFQDLPSSSTNVGDSKGNNREMEEVEMSGDAIESMKDPFNMNIFSVMFGFFMSGNLIVVIAGLFFAIVFISIMFYFFTVYIVCVITLYVLAYISPIFITFALFERTKSYFDSWVKIVLSCVLQPAVVGGFVAIIVTMYDTTLYGTCEFQRYDYEAGDERFSTFAIRIPDSYPKDCIESPGYRLAQYYFGDGWEEVIFIIFAVPIINDIYNLGSGLVYILIFTFIFYYIMQYISEFASDLTSGPSVESVTAAPTKAITAAIAAATFIKNAIQGKPKVPSSSSGGKSRGGAGDKFSGGESRGGASDKISAGGGSSGGGGGGSAGGGGASDKISFGDVGDKGSSGGSSGGGGASSGMSGGGGK